jgi:hypothetical protein
MFIAFANHPAVKSLVTVSKAQADAANKTIGDLFMRLLTASCKDDARRALQYEGTGAIEAGFQVLGLVAGRELATSPDVAAGLAALEKHIDKNRLQGLTKNPASAGQ